MDFNNDVYEILDIINSVAELTIDVYEELTIRYDKKLVDNVIDDQIDENNLEKYKYYLDLKNEEYKQTYVGIYNQYIYDIQKYKKFNNEENKKRLGKIAEIKDELYSIFEFFGLDIGDLSVLEQIDFCLDNILDKEILSKVRDLSSKYIELRNELVMGNLSLVVAMTRPYSNESVDHLELIQNGNEGLIKAIDKYDVTKNAKFSSYACYWIKAEIILGLKRNNTLFTTPAYIYNDNVVRLKTTKELNEKLGRDPSDLEVAMKMGVSPKKIKKIKMTFEEILSLSDLVEMEALDDSLVDFLVDDDSDVFEAYIEKEKKIEMLNKIKKCLTDDEYYVIAKRYGIEDNEEMTYEEIGNMLEMSKSNVALVEKRALMKMRRKCKNLAVYW